MAAIERLYRASFRGASFLMRDTELSAGRKSVTFEYPNQSKRYVEDLGGLLRKYTINAIITGPFYDLKKRALQAALSKPGVGILVHPTDGRVNVVAKPYTLSEDVTRIGEAQFTMEFEESDQGIYPISDADNSSKIFDLINSVLDGIETSIAEAFSVADTFRYNIDDAANILTRVSNTFDSVTAPFSLAGNASDEFNNSLTNFQSNIYSNIKNPAQLGSSLTGLFSLSDDLGTTAQDRYKIANGFYGFGSDDTYIPQDTAQRIERQGNRSIINSAMNAAALANAYSNAIEIDYGNTEELDKAIFDLDKQYSHVASISTLSDETNALLVDLRNEVRKFFDKLSVNVYKLTTINTQPDSLINIVYAYYGNLDNLEKIITLNKIANPARVEGQLTILTGVAA